jgi:hypothetical protein
MLLGPDFPEHVILVRDVEFRGRDEFIVAHRRPPAIKK